MHLIWIVLGALFFIAFVFWRLVMTASRWGREMIELQQAGVEVTGTVISKVRYRGKGGGESRSLRYEYVDQFGERHGRTVLVTREAWDGLEEGGPIPIVYSQRQPKISAPRYLLQVMEKGRPSPS